MGTSTFRFESLTIYQRSLTFSKNIYQLTQSFPREHLFGITDQLRRAALSIPLNIAEGTSRTRKDFRHFLIIARGSCFECVPLLELAISLKLLSQQQGNLLYNELNEISRMLSSFRNTLDHKLNR